jgi:cbb3-type cytochrome oxidase maturation protein
MSVIFIVLPLALLVVAAGVAAYVWAARSGQFDDTTTPPMRVVTDDDDAAAPKEPPGKRKA